MDPSPCQNPADPNFTNRREATKEVSELPPKEKKGCLKIMQFNADGLSTKTTELEHRLKAENVDVCAIQETKLTPDKRSPSIKGYVPAGRNDRRAMKFGGVIFYVKDSLVFERVQESSKEGTESATIRVKMSRKKWIVISNIYVPPHNTTHPVRFKVDEIPTSDDCLIVGELNGHSPLWDPIQPPDTRGEEIENWMINEDLVILNDGSGTHVNRITGGLSTPDVTLAGKKWSNKHNWSLGDQIGKSDHLPIIIIINEETCHQSVSGKYARW